MQGKGIYMKGICHRPPSSFEGKEKKNDLFTSIVQLDIISVFAR